MALSGWRRRPGSLQRTGAKNAGGKSAPFCGSVENIASVYACADVFAMPSYYEAFSLATLEAAAAGLPLIVTRVNGTEDLVVDRWNGFFVERSPECVAEALDRVIEDPSLLSALSRQARIRPAVCMAKHRPTYTRRV